MLLHMSRPLDRREFLTLSAATVAAATLPAAAQKQTGSPRVAVTVDTSRPGAQVPANFLGLSYEIEQLKDPGYFSLENRGLINQFRALTPKGVLRLGGNTSDVGWWKPNAASTRPPSPIRKDAEAGEPTVDSSYAIEPRAITNLRAFLDACGWTCLFGINLGSNTDERAADEAAFVAKTLGWAHAGGRLEYFQLGNEPDLFQRHLRDPKTWNADAYFDEWLRMAHAITARVPAARFGLPDTSGNPKWYATVVDRLLALPAAQRPDVAALTHHYYLGGPPSNPSMNLGKVLHADPRVLELAHDIHAAAARLADGEHHPVPYRMSEGNTCYRGGKPGVSDVFAASLWAADYCLLLASLGYVGVNLHGGGGQEVANSLGGKLPGEALMADPTLPHPRPFYTPIADINGKEVFEPVAYGMLFAGHFAGATMLPISFDPGPVNATAYAAKLPTGQIVVAVLNKDETRDLVIDLPGYSTAAVLSAPSLTSTSASLTEPEGNRETSLVRRGSAVLLQSAQPV